MGYQYTNRNGQRVEVNVAAAFDRMNGDFARDTGCTLRVNSGTRTSQEQKDIFFSRYVTAGNVRGRRVYDTRWYGGVLYYRVSASGTVAQPGTSNHEENGPIGPRAIDIADSGNDRGVMSRGTSRDKWMERNAGNYAFQNEGYGFGEPWHKKFTGGLSTDAPAPAPAPAPAASSVPADAMHGWNFGGIQKMLKAYRYGYTGGIDHKASKGGPTARAFQKFLNAKGYAQRAGVGTLVEDGILLAKSVKATQQWLNETGRKAGNVDGIPGGGTHGAWDVAEADNYRAFPNVW